MDLQRITAVFRDAHVVDVDFSVWDREVRLVVVAVEETASAPKRLPVYEVSFQGVTTFTGNFPQQTRPLAHQHRQWNIYGVEVTTLQKSIRLFFAGSSQDPALEVVCQDIVVASLEISILDQLFPGWARPGAALARPSIRELWESRLRR